MPQLTFFFTFPFPPSVPVDETKAKLDELLLAAGELPAVSQALRDLGQYAKDTKAYVGLTEAQITFVRDTFKCIICRGL